MGYWIDVVGARRARGNSATIGSADALFDVEMVSSSTKYVGDVDAY